ESFLALPFDPLYYFLTGKDSPTRQLIFFEHFNIFEQQQRDVIAELEKNNTTYVVLSNRSVLSAPGMGIFGQTYCQILADYLQRDFAAVASFGDWAVPAGWAENHATRIYKRRPR
ncbi:MAG: hypothetical protein WC552_08910, partial [Candidatus Omnitrophota bacterium]